ncbi:retention module-containing protein, partial [Achromobacter sp. Marseille-Q4962]|uniref:retention module-containing protein n=1 Tax=Achromobacter sp. Marseille-Q4962 TaxID=2942202 RepID=UPI002073773A
MANASPAIVSELTGRAWIRNSDGSLTELHEGSKVPAGSDIVTASGATLTLQVENGMPLVIGENRDVALNGDAGAGPLADPSEAAVAPPSGTDSDRLLAALEAGRDPFDELDPTAAIVAGSGDAGGSSFVRLARILETTTPLDLSYPNPSRGEEVIAPLAGASATDDDGAGNAPPLAVNDAVGTRQDDAIRGNLLSNDSDPDGDALTLVSVNGRPMTSEGITVPGSNGGVFTVYPDGSYVFNPNGEYKALGEGETAVSTVSYTITDPSGATSTATVAVTVTGVLDVPTISVSDAGTVNEGGIATFDISLGNTIDLDRETTITLKIGGQVEAGDVGTPVVTIGGVAVTVTANPDGTYSFQLPAGVTGGIVVAVPTTDDATFEGRESLTLEATLSGQAANGAQLPAGITDTGTATIVDVESTDPSNPNPGADIPSLTVGDAGDINEGSSADFNVSLSKPVDADTTITFKLSGEIEAGDVGTPTVTIGGQSVVVTANQDGTYSITVPAGTTDGIVVTVPTTDDTVFEGRESLTLEATLTGSTASGVALPDGITDTGSATIVDTESTDPSHPNPGADVPALSVSDAGDVDEGSEAVFNVALTKPVDADTTLTFKLGGDIEAGDVGTPTVTIGGQSVVVTNNGNGTYSITVPAGTTDGIVVTVPTTDDAVFEGRESLTLEATLTGESASGVALPDGITDTGSATIVDTQGGGKDVPALTVSDAGDVNEGSNAVFNVALTKPVDADTTLTFTLGGQIEGDDVGTPTVTIGGQSVVVTANQDGTYSITVPAGTTGGIVVTVPTTDDTVFEGRESLTLEATLTGSSASGVALPGGITDTGNAVIVDDHGPGADVPALTVSDAGDVNEGSNAVFNVALTKPVDADTTLTFKLGGDIEAGDVGTPTVTIGGQSVVVTNNGNNTYSITVPAGTTGGIVVTVPTTDDAVFEGRESLTLEATLTGESASGVALPGGITDTGSATIVDTESTDPSHPNPGADVPALSVSDAGDVNEGSEAVFNVALTKPVDADTTLTFTLGGQIEAGDVGTPTVTIGGQSVVVTNNGNGTYSITVPAGTTGGIVVTVPTNDDAVFEGR